MVNHNRYRLASGSQLGLNPGRNGNGVCRLLVAAGLVLATPAGAEPEKFDWRFIAEEDARPASGAVAEPPLDNEPNPVVLPKPGQTEEAESRAGWHWLRPQIASSTSGSDRTAVQLAEQAQEADMARQNSPLNGVLPGHLNGLAPMAVESGVEWRF